VDAEAAEPRPHPERRRLVFWAVFVGLIAASNYAQRFLSSGGSTSNGASHQDVYSYSFFAGGAVIYAIWLGITLLIVIDRFDLLALRAPQRWAPALGLALAVVGVVFAWEAIVSYLPLPESPNKEQGLTNVHWEPSHAGAFAANFVLLAVVAPIVEELTFRGAGQSLLGFLGRWPSIVLVGIVFGLAHGLVEALLVLVFFGMAVAWLRDRTDSVLPGMLVHAVFNGAALAFVVWS
jgi:membrane protease YdiL (CAAX protease family)